MLNVKSYRLTPEAVDAVSDSVQAFLTQLGTERKNILRMTLTLEDILLKWKAHFGESTEFTLSTGRRFGRTHITLTLPGEPFDPTAADDGFGEISARLSAELGLYPEYVYYRGANIVTYKLKARQKSPIAVLLGAILAACLLGAAGSLLLPDSTRSACCEYLLTPVYDTFIGLLNTVAGPMIFLSVAWGIYGIGDAATLSRIGKRLLLRFVALTALITAFTIAVILPFLGLHFASRGMDLSGLNKIVALLLNAFPKNIVSPFLEGNTMQIILLASVLGCILLFQGERTKTAAKLLEQLNDIIRYAIELIGLLIPPFIFIILLRLIWSGSVQEALTVWKPFLCYVAVVLLGSVLAIVYVCIRQKVRFPVLTAKLLPTFLIAFTTASSSAAFGSMTSACDRDLGVSPKISNFGIPLGMVLFKPATAVCFTSYVLFFTKQYGLDISVSWIFFALFVVTVLTVALPPIPGGALACYTILFLQLGIPADALGAVMVLDVFADFTSTGFDTVFRQCELVLTADKVSLLDKEMLRGKRSSAAH